MADYVMTIDSDDEHDQRDDEPALDPKFSFDVTGGALVGLLDAWDASDVVKSGSKPEPISVDDIIERRRLKAQAGTKRKRDEDQSEDEWEDEDEEGNEQDELEDSDEESAIGGSANDHDQGDDPLTSDDEDTASASEHSEHDYESV
ncbi:ATP-dependent RNA helicase DDX27 [Ceratobasidium sp. AG-Ba]|nr:ATP-dependent RNA helicase DDX27 [Ceratobasidium sp. AG-Ba]